MYFPIPPRQLTTSDLEDHEAKPQGDPSKLIQRVQGSSMLMGDVDP